MFSLNTYCYPFIMSIMSFLMYPWYLSCAYACNRCTGRDDIAGIQETERGVVAANTGGSWGAALRRNARRGRRWVLGASSVQLCERQAPEHIKPPTFWNAIKVLLWHVYCCIKFRCWMKTLAALVIQSLSRYWYPESYVAQVRVVLSPA
jgi:ABC-type sugar transport system permease subunit